jgi:hypothetical protein
MARREMRNIFSDEGIELMLTIRREEEERTQRAAQRSARGKRPVKPRAAEPAPDRRTAPKKTGKGGLDPSPGH